MFLVMSDGCVSQFGQPYELLCKNEGILSELVNDTGQSSKDRLFQMARQAYFTKINGEIQEENIENRTML